MSGKISGKNYGFVNCRRRYFQLSALLFRVYICWEFVPGDLKRPMADCPFSKERGV